MTALCATRPTEWWTELGDVGNRQAIMLCRVCPARRGNTCGGPGIYPDPAPAGVIRAGIAYNDRGVPMPQCPCAYPVHDYRGGNQFGGPPQCARCRIPDVPIPNRRSVQCRAARLARINPEPAYGLAA